MACQGTQILRRSPAQLARSVLSEAPVSIGRRPSCAVSMSKSIGIPKVFGVPLDRIDHQVESTGAVDVARIPVCLDQAGWAGLC